MYGHQICVFVTQFRIQHPDVFCLKNSREVGIEMQGDNAKPGYCDIWWISTQCALMMQ